ncbi:hypothetical protein KTS45_13205 [Halomicroarcula limicola]|uniref:histidine kinase n=2 Tax=Haloarcula limicola TaxID=1429915 RepID=A0A8J7YAQ4_9EURY|nr:hypothetical protein [Halomicroarcula limicola]
MEQSVRQTRAEGEARIEARLLTATGETIPYEFISKRIVDGGETVGRAGLGWDISERKRYEKRIERQNERLEHFAEVLSHDLRNPLTVAQGHLKLLNQTGDEGHYEKSKRALSRMENLISDVLTLAQSGKRISLSEYETTDLETIAEDAWVLIQKGQATLDVDRTRRVEADASHLQ